MQTNADLASLKAEKLRRLQQEKLRHYQPHPTQLKLHQSQAKTRSISAGNQFGKTTAGVVEALWITGKVHPYRKNFTGQVRSRIVVQDEGVLDSVLLDKLREYCPRRACEINGLKFAGLKGGSFEEAWSPSARTLIFADGSFIEFKTYKQERQSHAGAQREFLWFDEEPPRDINEENLARQTAVGINVLYTFTPLNYAQWSYRSLYMRAATDPDVEIFFAPTSENKFVSAETLANLESSYTDPAERAARLEGRFTYMEGLVYKDYGDHNVIDPALVPTNGVKYSIVIDPHEQKATAWNLFAESHWEKDGVNRIYCIGEGDEEGDVEYICNQIFAKTSEHPISLWLCDPSARRSARIRGHNERLIDEFRRFIPQLIEANNSLDVGITRLRAAFKPIAGGRRPKAMVSKLCPVTDHQLRNYSWKPPLKSGEDRSKPMVSLRENDHPDIFRYRIMHVPVYETEATEPFEVAMYGA